MLKIKLKSLDKCFLDHKIDKRSSNYWRVIQLGVEDGVNGLKSSVGFRTFYKSYFGSGKIVTVKQHKKWGNILQMYSDKGMHMMDIFTIWVDEWVEGPGYLVETASPGASAAKTPRPPKKTPVVLHGLLEKWDDITKGEL